MHYSWRMVVDYEPWSLQQHGLNQVIGKVSLNYILLACYISSKKVTINNN